MSNIIIAVDPGTVDAGVCLAVDGEILGTKKLHVPSRWKKMDRILGMIDRIEHYLTTECEFVGDDQHHTSLAYELPVTFRNKETDQVVQIIPLHQLVAVLEYWARGLQIATFPYLVNDIKEVVARSGTASKKEVEVALKFEYGWQDKTLSDHEWDALSIYTYHLRQVAVAERTIV